MFELGIRVEGVVHHDDRPDFQDRVVGDHAGDHVGQENRHGVPLLDPEIGQAGGKAVHLLLELAEVHARPLKEEGRLVGELLRHPVQDIGHADLFVFDEFRHAFFVGLQPQFFLILCLSHSRPLSLLYFDWSVVKKFLASEDSTSRKTSEPEEVRLPFLFESGTPPDAAEKTMTGSATST